MSNDIDIKKLLGRRIKEIRTKRKLTQEKLAEMIGVGERNLSKIECGNNFITAETLSKVINALSIEPQELFIFDHHKDESFLKKELLDIKIGRAHV